MNLQFPTLLRDVSFHAGTSFTSDNLSNTQFGQDPNQNCAYDMAKDSTTKLYSSGSLTFEATNDTTEFNSGAERLAPVQTNEVSAYKSMTGASDTKSGDMARDMADTDALVQQVKPGAMSWCNRGVDVLLIMFSTRHALPLRAEGFHGREAVAVHPQNRHAI